MAEAVIGVHRRPDATRSIDIALVLFAVPAALLAWGLTTAHDRPIALLVAIPIVGGVILRTRPLLAGVAIGAGATLLRLAYTGVGYSTQVDHARNAADRVLSGLSPYGVLLPSATAPPEPYVYGPLGLLWWQPGVVVEVGAAIGVTALLIWGRAWITLALYSGLPFSVYLTTTGVNDYSPGLLIAAGWVLLRARRPVLGSAVLAMAAAIKPYAAAWFMPAIGHGGVAVMASLAAVTALLWSPLLWWGPVTFLRSVQLNDTVHPVAANALNVPALRIVALPLALVGLLVRPWSHAILVGSAVFVVVLFLDRWASLGYWLAVIPVTGLALEGRWAQA